MAQPRPIRTRTYSLDNLRTVLTILVILHHAALPYGGAGTWFYVSPHHALFSSATLLAFNLLNQTFFMAAFFLLSGYFSAIVARKKSRRQFLLGKVKRLGVPALVYSLFAPSVMMGGLVWLQGQGWEEARERFWEELGRRRGVSGPVWYCALLLVFDVLYVVLRPGDFGSVKKEKQEDGGKVDGGEKEVGGKPREQTVSTVHVLGWLAFTSMVAFLVRTVYPIGTTIPALNLTVGYVPQYVLYYVRGIYIHRRLRTELHKSVSKRIESIVFVLAASIAIAGFSMVYVEASQPGKNIGTVINLARGGWNKFAVLYAVFNEFVGSAISTFLLRWFAEMECFKREWRVYGWDVARYSYPAFLVHAPVTVYLQCLVDRLVWDPVSKSVLVGVLGTMLSWGVGWGVTVLVEDFGGLRGFV